MPDDTSTTTDTAAEDAEAAQLLNDAIHGQQSGTDADSDGDTDAQRGGDADQVTKLQEELDNWKRLARKHEDRAKQNAAAAKQAQTVEQRIAELERELAERSVADLEHRGRLAKEKVTSALAEAGIKRGDVQAFLDMVDPVTTLLKDGEPNEQAIRALTESLKRLAGRVRPDPDQGRSGGTAPVDMNALIRKQAGVIR
jgi:myosin heavy subunit